MDSVGEGEGGKIWENGIEKKKKSHMSAPHTVLSGKWTCTDNIGFRVLARFYLVGTDPGDFST